MNESQCYVSYTHQSIPEPGMGIRKEHLPSCYKSSAIANPGLEEGRGGNRRVPQYLHLLQT
jgi:hypothetical protein